MGESSSRLSTLLMSSSSNVDLELPELGEESTERSQPVYFADLPLLTCPSLGLQVCWFLLMSSGTPYLFSLGIPKSIISLVWITGPVFGTSVQPIFGVLSDNLHHSWGKRKPFIVVGATCATVFLLVLAFSRELTRGEWHPSVATAGSTIHYYAQLLAVMCVIMVTFALQAYQVGLRALIVDTCRPSQQSAAASWVMRWNVLGNVVLSSVGFADAQWSLLGADSNSRFKILAVVVAVCCVGTVGLMCSFVPDKSVALPRGYQISILQLWESVLSPKGLLKSWRQLPPRSRRVCEIQFYAWAGWSPVLYYMSLFAFETALTDKFEQTQEQGALLDDDAFEKARKFEFFAAFAFALGAFSASVLLWVLDQRNPNFSRKLPQIWLCSQCFLGYCMHLTIVARTGTTATIVVAMMGATAAVTMWVPFVLISAEISELSAGEWDGEVAWILGLHNMAISLPQIGSSFVCAMLLAVFNLVHVKDSVAWMFRIASMPVFWSAYLIYMSL